MSWSSPCPGQAWNLILLPQPDSTPLRAHPTHFGLQAVPPHWWVRTLIYSFFGRRKLHSFRFLATARSGEQVPAHRPCFLAGYLEQNCWAGQALCPLGEVLACIPVSVTCLCGGQRILRGAICPFPPWGSRIKLRLLGLCDKNFSP